MTATQTHTGATAMASLIRTPEPAMHCTPASMYKHQQGSVALICSLVKAHKCSMASIAISVMAILPFA